MVGDELQDPQNVFFERYGIAKEGAVLVRPDGHVAWRSTGDADDAQRSLSEVLRTVLHRTGTSVPGPPDAEVTR